MTSAEFDVVYFLYLIISITVFFTVLFVGINANVVVLIAILGDKKMRNSATSLLLFNLAVADLLYLIVVLLWLAFTPDIRAFLCPIYKWIQNSLLLGSVVRCSEENGIRHSNDASIKSALRTRKSVIKMLIICMVMFFICYTPMTILFFLVGVLDWHVLYVELSMSFAMLVMVPSAANPFLYALFSNTFRQRVRAVMPRLFDICCVRKQGNAQVSRRSTGSNSS
ncbi:7 transmembrane receptor (rhodopsin family) domain-containing protein [Ditylenchus destructor]|nr:7 transmembrane receptor (rhodopsin family) domain-containing protein [Ditylenchus destructor]